MTLHRELQLVSLNDRASHERVMNYIRAIKAANIGNNGGARYFTTKARQWERIRAASAARLLA